MAAFHARPPQIILSSFGIATLVLARVALGHETLPSDAIASVNGHVIPEKLFSSLVRNNREVFRVDSDKENAGKLKRVRQAVLEELIERALIIEEAVKRKVLPSPLEIDEAEKKLITTFGGEEHYRVFLKENNLSQKDYRQEVVLPALARERLIQCLGRELPVKEEDVTVYYRTHNNDSDFQFPERVSAAHIHVDMRPEILAARLQHDQPELKGEALEKAIATEKIRRRQLADDLRTQLLAGADFAQLAAKYSDDPGTKNQGGDLGFFPRRAHPHEFEEAAFNLKQPGDLSEVTEDFYGLHIIKLKEHQAAHVITLAEAASEIRVRLERQNQNVSYQSWLKEARQKAHVVTRTP
jgi:parvulin-like peptidyl-prolyl isomerase